jgi:hypothetical protein
MSTIDIKNEKKNNESGFKTDYKEFAINLTKSVLFKIVIYMLVFGTIGLYLTKIADSNLFNYINRIILENENIETVNDVSMHIIKTNWLNYENATSQKATFESNNSYLMKTLNTYLNFMQDRGKYKNGGYINRLGLFASTLCKNILATDFSIINYIYLTIGKLPEGVTMFISPIIGLFLFCVLFPINFFYSFYFITEIFKDDNGTEWFKDKKSILTNIFFYLIHFMSMFFFGWLPPLIIVCCLTFFNTFYAIFLPLIASYKDNSQKSKNLMNFISDTLYYKQKDRKSVV